MNCPSILSGDSANLSTALLSLDCQISTVVETAYTRLFGSGGSFGVVLTALLTIFIALIAFGFLTGRTRLTLGAMAPKVLALGLVLTFATSWPAYQIVVYGLLTGGPDQIASAVLGGKGGASAAFAFRLDQLFASVVEIAQSITPAGDKSPPSQELAAQLVWSSAIILLIATMGLLVVARVVLTFMLALGPIFIVFAMFRSTRGLFEGWLRTTIAFSLAPMLVVLGGSGAIAMLSPLINQIAQDPAAALVEMQPILMLFLGVIIYALLLLVMAWTAVNLTRSLGLPKGGFAQDRSAGAPHLNERRAASGTVNASTAASAATVTTGDRTAAIIAAVSREDASRAPRIVANVQVENERRGAGNRTRRDGIGQAFRSRTSKSAGPRLSGRIGS